MAWTLQNWVGPRTIFLHVSIYNHTLNVGDCIHEKWNSWNPSNKKMTLFFLKTIFLFISEEFSGEPVDLVVSYRGSINRLFQLDVC